MHACFLHFKAHWPVKSCDQNPNPTICTHILHLCACACGMRACSASRLSRRAPCCLASRGRRSQRCKLCRSMLVWGICLYPPQSAAPRILSCVHTCARVHYKMLLCLHICISIFMCRCVSVRVRGNAARGLWVAHRCGLHTHTCMRKYTPTHTHAHTGTQL